MVSRSVLSPSAVSVVVAAPARPGVVESPAGVRHTDREGA
jgi:hypothetical protein